MLEKMCAEFMRTLFGLQVFNGYFENKYSNFVNAFPKELQNNIREITKKLDTYHALSMKVFTGKSTFNEIEMLQSTVSSIINDLYEITEIMGISKDNLIEFLNDRINVKQYKVIRDLIGYDIALDNIVNQTL